MTLGVELELLRALHAARRAVVAAVAYDLVTLEAIAAAGEATGCPVIAQVGSSAFGLVHGPALIAAARTVAGAVTAPVGLHLDHSRDLDEIRRCLDAGYTSVMIDGSRLSLGANIELSARAVEVARPYGVWVEAELGHLSGNEDRSVGAVAGQLTEPAEAARFVADTGVDALAVSIGNAHGRTATPVVLDLDLLAEIAEATPVPLVLHGASGVPDSMIAAAVELGVAKLNVNADLRAAHLGAITAHAAADPTGDDLPGALVAARGALTSYLTSLVNTFTA
ncbi:MAG: class II fructose-bisphosphate aldolase [Acidimicrobiia bacterium]|nr:class II fructose-bisphosphate aldolase [Acidimicrobiia bacterium]MDH5291489.1 class II fructose-bisphosphate aldolase [Acidimicrobiia bacterium]